MESPVATRRPCFVGGGDDGLASIAVMESGFPGTNNKNNNNNNNNNGFLMMRRRNSLRNLSSLSSPLSPSSSSSVYSPRSGRFYESRSEEIHSPHFLEACFLCKRTLGDNRDIFMYRGDTPFCSEECREKQIEFDEAKEKNRNLKALRSKKESTKSSSSSSSSTSPSKNQNYPFRTGTVAAA